VVLSTERAAHPQESRPAIPRERAFDPLVHSLRILYVSDWSGSSEIYRSIRRRVGAV